MVDLEVFDSVSDEDDCFFQTSSGIESHHDGLRYEVYKEQRCVPPKVHPSKLVVRGRS